MIELACQNVTEGTDSDDFCLDFFFFTDEADEKRRLKRQKEHLYGSFYSKVTDTELRSQENFYQVVSTRQKPQSTEDFISEIIEKKN